MKDELIKHWNDWDLGGKLMMAAGAAMKAVHGMLQKQATWFLELSMQHHQELRSIVFSTSSHLKSIVQSGKVLQIILKRSLLKN